MAVRINREICGNFEWLSELMERGGCERVAEFIERGAAILNGCQN
jgi:hypothetical protein